MFSKILVPLDGSSLAESVLPHINAMLHRSGAEVILLHVLEQDSPSDQSRPVDPLSWRFRHIEAKSYLEEVSNRLQEAGLTASIEPILLEGQAAERIVKFAHERGVDLIALSSHGRTGLSRWNVSSVVQKIILHAQTSIFLARAYQADQPVLSDLRYQHILVPLDGSQRAECVLPILGVLSQEHESEILLSHVVAYPEMPRRVPLIPEEKEVSQRVVEFNQAEATRYFDRLKSRIAGNVQTRVIVSENVAATLHNLVADERIDLVVLSAHGYSAMRQYPYGSVSMSFIANGTTPLLIIQDLPPQEMGISLAEIIANRHGNSGRKLIYDKPSA